jgi:hypothetical protein
MPFQPRAEETDEAARWLPRDSPRFEGPLEDVAMGCRQVSSATKVGISLALLMVVMAAGTSGVCSAQERGQPAFGAGLKWQSPAIQQTAGYSPSAAESSRARPATPARPGTNRIAMNDGEIVIDGGMTMFDGDPEFVGSAGLSGGTITEPCTSCRTPPWHGSVAPPACYGPGHCGPACDPCDPCHPCDPCDRPYRRSCFPRLQALFGEGYLASPMPPCEPRCRHCGAAVPVGF